ncbi:hypothetical protein FY528_11890 [Hymenobacter lutimineralis]|uniref:Uncharacterized protein n=1 Tax=Hymenobacter lutimineralis TaxID=2606448 RepID=A0A5D6V0G6_9BACT|nr:hypothetical protein [Hymenobacter lutimineralis]TYZ08910.1 hypothetical protein FY528_11890 [Hymenobacter lutimineralis]
MTRLLLLGFLACPALALAQQTNLLESRRATPQLASSVNFQALADTAAPQHHTFGCPAIAEAIITIPRPIKPYLSLQENLRQVAGIQVTPYSGAHNLLVLSKYRGYDPNISSAGADAKQAGLDHATYPTARTILLGVQATL